MSTMLNDYIATVIQSWPQMLVYGLLDYVTDFMIYPSIAGMGGWNARYLASGINFSAKKNVPIIDISKFGWTSSKTA